MRRSRFIHTGSLRLLTVAAMLFSCLCLPPEASAASPVVSKVLADLKMPLGCNDAITNEWSFPESVSQGGRTWVVNANTNALELGLAPFTLADTNAIPTAGGKGIFFQRRNDCLLVEYIASRISSPEFFPTDYSALWNCQTNASGLTFLRSTTYSPNMPDYVLFKNVGVCISGITNSCELGVAFLRAGGVEIPDEPPLQHPETE